MNKEYGVTNVWLGGEVVEVTSTDEKLLENLVNYMKNDLLIKLNKIDIKKNEKLRRIMNITVKPLEDSPNEAFMFFWAVLAYLCDAGWEPNGNTGDAFSFKIQYQAVRIGTAN